MRFLTLILLISALVSCSKKDVRDARVGLNPAEQTKYYFTTATSLTVQVAYESGHAPYADGVTLGGGISIWQVLEENLNTLFLGRSPLPVIKVPKTLAEMQEIPVQGKSVWKAEDIIALAQQHRSGQSSQAHSYFWVVFLDGYFHDGSETREEIIGVSLGGTTVIAIFKDVVEGTDTNGLGIIPKYAEQATVVHEMGHALGLVDNGLPMKESHIDEEHGHHCNNDKCVMYYLNEGKRDMIQFALRFSQSGQLIMFDQKCLDDARGY